MSLWTCVIINLLFFWKEKLHAFKAQTIAGVKLAARFIFCVILCYFIQWLTNYIVFYHCYNSLTSSHFVCRSRVVPCTSQVSSTEILKKGKRWWKNILRVSWTNQFLLVQRIQPCWFWSTALGNRSNCNKSNVVLNWLESRAMLWQVIEQTEIALICKGVTISPKNFKLKIVKQ